MASNTNDTPAPRQANQRGAARLGAVQALYQMDIGEISLEKTLVNFAEFLLGKEVEGDQYLPADEDFFRQIVKGVVQSQLDIDPMIDANLPTDWPVTRIDALLRAILRASVFELLKRPDIPAGVVISEYLDIARAFYDGEVPGLVNGVLDAVAKRVANTG
jgi:transcription antitermination protein NusB